MTTLSLSNKVRLPLVRLTKRIHVGFIASGIILLWVAGVETTNAQSVTYVCDYPRYSDQNGLQKVNKPFGLTFLLDTSTNKAYVIGAAGSEPVSVVPNSDAGLTLVEVTGSGNVMVTAITKKGDSVHSRSTNLFGDLVPSQYYGKCQRK